MDSAEAKQPGRPAPRFGTPPEGDRQQCSSAPFKDKPPADKGLQTVDDLPDDPDGVSISNRDSCSAVGNQK
jgi:hypothetical protein